MNRRDLLRLMPLLASVAQAPAKADEGAYPDRPIHFLVPFAAGGALDILARLLGEQLHDQMKQTIVVENRPGANGNVAMEVVAKAPADGYTIMIGSNGLATNRSLYRNSTLDVLRDLAPVAYIGYAPLVAVVPASAPYRSLREFVLAAEAAPGKLSYASAGAGSSGHLAAEMLKDVAKIDITHVPYKGGAPALVDLISGRVNFMLLDPPQVLPHLRAGRLRALAVGGAQRLPLLPDVPTLAEAGYAGVDAAVWWGIVAPAKLPPAIVTRLNAEFNGALARPEVQARLQQMGVVEQPGPPERFLKHIQEQTAKWAGIVQRAGISLD